MIESVVDEPFTCPTCGKSSDEHPTMDVSNAKTIFLCQDRAAKWQRVEPGTVIPAGQPYRVEYGYDVNGRTAHEAQDKPCARVVPEHLGHTKWFVDSSWKPPLVLPTEPTWGIAVYGPHVIIGHWCLNKSGNGLVTPEGRWVGTKALLDFIPLTDEQVKRIEAAR